MTTDYCHYRKHVWTHGYSTYRAAVQYVSDLSAETRQRVLGVQNEKGARRAGVGSAEIGREDPRKRV